MLTLSDITLERGGNKLVSGISVTLLPGSVMVLKGANGCGKTTLLECLAGFHIPASGGVLWNDERIDVIWDEYRAGLLYIGHKNALKQELTVLENLKFWAELWGNPIALMAAIAAYNLEEIADVYVGKLSEGQKRRAALSKMFLKSSDLWLLDEPLTNLDSYYSDVTLNAITTKANNGGIIILSSHSKIAIKGCMEFEVGG